MSIAIDAETLAKVRLARPEVFDRPFRKRFAPLLVALGVLAYVAYALWFFAIPQVVMTAQWERFGYYLSQWVSFTVQVELRPQGDTVRTVWPRYSQLGSKPDPDWVHADGANAVFVDLPGAGNRFEITGSSVVVTRGGEAVRFDLTGPTLQADRELPDWVQLSQDEVDVSWGFWGRATFDRDRAKVYRTFLGWANFLFDTRSPFFGKSPSEVLSLIVSGPRIDPAESNLDLALSNIWNNAEWQHGDVWTKLLQTIVMAFAGTLMAAMLAFPLSFLAARNITHSRLVNQLFKRAFDFLRSVDMLIWALFFTRAFGPGPLAGTAAIFFTDTGTLGKLYSEALENIDDKPREGLQSVGASNLAVQRFGVVPQILPVFASQALYFWESNSRSATIIGAVGAGGIGLKLWEAMRTNTNWANVFYMVILILIMVYVFDAISNALRRRLIGDLRG